MNKQKDFESDSFISALLMFLQWASVNEVMGTEERYAVLAKRDRLSCLTKKYKIEQIIKQANE